MAMASIEPINDPSLLCTVYRYFFVGKKEINNKIKKENVVKIVNEIIFFSSFP